MATEQQLQDRLSEINGYIEKYQFELDNTEITEGQWYNEIISNIAIYNARKAEIEFALNG